MRYNLFVATTQCRHCSTKAATDNIYSKGGGYVLIKLYLKNNRRKKIIEGPHLAYGSLNPGLQHQEKNTKK